MNNRTPEEIERIKKERHEAMIEYIKTMEPFTSEDDIIDVPVTDPETYKNIVKYSEYNSI